MRKILSALILLFLVLSSPAFAQSSITINTNFAPYNSLSNVQGSGISADIAVRQAGIFQITGAYRLAHGSNSLPKDTIITIIYQDGSSEKAKVTSNLQTGSITAQIIDGSQRDGRDGASGANAPGTGGNGGSSVGIVGSGGGGSGSGSTIITIGEIEPYNDN